MIGEVACEGIVTESMRSNSARIARTFPCVGEARSGVTVKLCGKGFNGEVVNGRFFEEKKWKDVLERVIK